MTMQTRGVHPASSSSQVQTDAPQWPAIDGSSRQGLLARPSKVRVDPDKTGDDLVKLVLVLVETIRQLVEKQAIRRVDSGTLSEDEIERLGLALLRLEERMTELKDHFGFTGDDLALKLGDLRELADEACHG